MRKNILPKLAVDLLRRERRCQNISLFLLWSLSLLSPLLFSSLFPTQWCPPPLYPLAFWVFFFTECIAFLSTIAKVRASGRRWKCLYQQIKRPTNLWKRKEKVQWRKVVLVLLWFPCQENIMWEKVEYFRELKRKREGRGKLVNGKNSVRRLVTTLRGKLLWELFPI